MIRADMDALAMREESGQPFSPVGPYAHTCGHDIHTAMLLGAARLLKKREYELNGSVKLMFQPAEENLLGAQAMLDAGILENPTVDAGMALHVFPNDMHVGTVACRPGAVLASNDSFEIHITGKAGHGAIPQNAVDPINVAAHMILSIQAINARETDPQEPLVLTVCSVHSGEQPNAIPQNAVMLGTIRTFSLAGRELAKKRLTEICEQTAKVFRTHCEVRFVAGVAPLHNDETLTQELNGYLQEIADNLVPMKRQMGSEDFANITQKIPAVFIGIGAGGADPFYQKARLPSSAGCF